LGRSDSKAVEGEEAEEAEETEVGEGEGDCGEGEDEEGEDEEEEAEEAEGEEEDDAGGRGSWGENPSLLGASSIARITTMVGESKWEKQLEEGEGSCSEGERRRKETMEKKRRKDVKE